MPFFVPVHPPRNPEECPGWLHEAIKRLNRYATNSTQALAAIGRGESPDSSGGPLIDLTKFLYKPGIAGGQNTFLGTLAGDSGFFSSTANATKGFIYLGSARTSSFDEVNERIGVGTGAPAARLHLKHATGGGVTTVLPLTTPPGGSGSAWGVIDGVGGSNRALALQTNDGDTTLIQSGSGTNGDVQFPMNPVSSTPSSCTIYAWADKGSAGTLVNSVELWFYNGTPPFGGGIGNGFTRGNFIPITAPLGVYTLYQYTLTPAEIALVAGGPGGWTDVHVGFRAGLSNSAVYNITQVYLEVPGSFNTTPLQRWEMPGSVINNLNYAQDSAAVTTLEVSGTPPFRVATSAMEIDIGTPTSTKLLASTDTEGTVAWTSINLLSTYHVDTVAASPVLGDIIYGNATPAWTKLAGNTTTTRKFLRQVGNGSISAVPAWDTLVVGDIPATSGASWNYVAVTGTYSVTTTDGVVDATSGTFTITLPTAVGVAGRMYVIKNSGAGVVTVATTSSQTIDGGTTAVLQVQYVSITVVSDGANWKVI